MDLDYYNDVNELKERACAVAIVKPVIEFFNKVFHEELKDQLAVIQVCEIIDPVRAEQQQPKLVDLNAFGLLQLPMVKQHPE